ncbi:hypothetical protein [Streptomyces sp. NPDC054863]
MYYHLVTEGVLPHTAPAYRRLSSRYAEKDTLRSLITRWVGPLGVPVLVVRGYGIQTYADVVRARAARDPRPAVLSYCGDLDASGEDVERDFVARTDCWRRVERIALTLDQVTGYALPPAVPAGGLLCAA